MNYVTNNLTEILRPAPKPCVDIFVEKSKHEYPKVRGYRPLIQHV